MPLRNKQFLHYRTKPPSEILYLIHKFEQCQWSQEQHSEFISKAQRKRCRRFNYWRRTQRCGSRLFHRREYSIQSSGQSTLPKDHQHDQNQRQTGCNKPQKCSRSIDQVGVTGQTRFEAWISCKFIMLQPSAGWLDKSSQQFLYGYDPCSSQIPFLSPPYSLLCATEFMLMISDHSLLDWRRIPTSWGSLELYRDSRASHWWKTLKICVGRFDRV